MQETINTTVLSERDYFEEPDRQGLGIRSLKKGQYFFSLPQYCVERNDANCIRCLVCVRQCTWDSTYYDPDRNVVYNRHENCVNCRRCEAMCPTQCIQIKKWGSGFRENYHWNPKQMISVSKQADTGGVLLTGCGNDLHYETYFDRMVIDASQVTNPSIDPLREPMELRTFIGRKPEKFDPEKASSISTQDCPNYVCEIPLIFAPMSFGSISYNFQEGLARAASEMGTYFNTGEGGLHPNFHQYSKRAIVQVASGRFGVSSSYLKNSAAVEIKCGQGAKPGIGGHLPGEKVTGEISRTRMIPEGSDAISPAPQHDIYSIEDLRLLIYALKEATEYTVPISVKIAAVHNVAAIASGIIRAGADIVVLDGFRGGTGAAPTVIRDHVGIPVEVAIAQVDQRLREEGIRHQGSIIAAGGIRSSADVVKAIALGADACYVGTAALIAVGCTLCQQCHRGKCAWGITTNRADLLPRLPSDVAAERLKNLLCAWSHEIKEMLGLMGLNSIESLRGNRLKLRGVGMNSEELNVLGIKQAGV
ncbi:MAG: FMN-binding glutamate synthase family protein [Phycisphaerae bacterium]|jgi:glutamate synthase domain-containing protein 2|nr:FMN-binding glutamate synthase family protein [Phycisphaerae bacterium]